jgi:chromosome segregation ATPase
MKTLKAVVKIDLNANEIKLKSVIVDDEVLEKVKSLVAFIENGYEINQNVIKNDVKEVKSNDELKEIANKYEELKTQTSDLINEKIRLEDEVKELREKNKDLINKVKKLNSEKVSLERINKRLNENYDNEVYRYKSELKECQDSKKLLEDELKKCQDTSKTDEKEIETKSTPTNADEKEIETKSKDLNFTPINEPWVKMETKKDLKGFTQYLFNVIKGTKDKDFYTKANMIILYSVYEAIFYKSNGKKEKLSQLDNSEVLDVFKEIIKRLKDDYILNDKLDNAKLNDKQKGFLNKVLTRIEKSVIPF